MKMIVSVEVFEAYMFLLFTLDYTTLGDRQLFRPLLGSIIIYCPVANILSGKTTFCFCLLSQEWYRGGLVISRLYHYYFFVASSQQPELIFFYIICEL